MNQKLVYVTGAGRGIGQAIALHLAQRGFLVTCCARSDDQLQETQKLSENKIRVKSLDVTQSDSLKNWMRQEVKETGATPWGLVTAAGIYGPIGPFYENSWDEWKKSIEINLYGTFLAVKHFAMQLMETKNPGRVVLLSGGGATQPLSGFTSYCASKSAVVRFGETVALELKPHNITVNSVAPGAVNTKLTDDLIAAGPEKAGADMYQKALKQKESGGTSPQKAAELTEYFLGPNAGGISGKLISAVWDPWPTLHDQFSKFEKNDVFTLRRIVPEDRKL